MRVYQRVGPNTGVSASFGEIGFWSFLVLLGALPFVLVGLAFVAIVWGVAIVLMVILSIYGIIYHKLTGKDARVPVPGSEGNSQIESFMEAKGWIRTPRTLTRNT